MKKIITDFTKFNILNEGKYFDEIKFHYENSSFGILTSYRDDDTPQKNKKDFNELKSLIKSEGYIFLELDGKGQEPDSTGKMQVGESPSLMVINDDIDTVTFENKIFKWGNKYNQYSVIVHDPKFRMGATRMFQTSTKSPKLVESWNHLNKGVSEFDSTYKGETFHFS